MTTYTIHVRRRGLDPDKDFKVVKEGFCWPAAIFGVFWALRYRLWLVSIVYVLVSVALVMAGIKLGLPELSIIPAELGTYVLFGFLANDLLRSKLSKSGFEMLEVVTASNEMQAEQIFFDRNQTLADIFAEAT